MQNLLASFSIVSGNTSWAIARPWSEPMTARYYARVLVGWSVSRNIAGIILEEISIPGSNPLLETGADRPTEHLPRFLATARNAAEALYFSKWQPTSPGAKGGMAPAWPTSTVIGLITTPRDATGIPGRALIRWGRSGPAGLVLWAQTAGQDAPILDQFRALMLDTTELKSEQTSGWDALWADQLAMLSVPDWPRDGFKAVTAWSW